MEDTSGGASDVVYVLNINVDSIVVKEIDVKVGHT
jgi:hypothetical protein